MSPNAIQMVKMLTGAVIALACLGALVFAPHLDPVERYALLGMVVGPGLLAGHGALKFQAPEEPKS
jgi:hypothetical protein